jgi:hypothetical protein
MTNMRNLLLVLLVLLCAVGSAAAQVSVGIGLPGVNIGINLPSFPELVRVQGYPAYYAPRLDANFFFYDGLYWVYQRDHWYASSWYNGPWGLVAPEIVPAFVLRIPVRYYRHPPANWSRFRRDAPPRWDEHWGAEWAQRRSGWNRWNRRAAPPAAALPRYQARYSREHYPGPEAQATLHRQRYQHQPQDPVVRQHYLDHGWQGGGSPAPSRRGRQQDHDQKGGPGQERGRGHNK